MRACGTGFTSNGGCCSGCRNRIRHHRHRRIHRSRRRIRSCRNHNLQEFRQHGQWEKSRRRTLFRRKVHKSCSPCPFPCRRIHCCIHRRSCSCRIRCCSRSHCIPGCNVRNWSYGNDSSLGHQVGQDEASGSHCTFRSQNHTSCKSFQHRDEGDGHCGCSRHPRFGQCWNRVLRTCRGCNGRPRAQSSTSVSTGPQASERQRRHGEGPRPRQGVSSSWKGLS
mmetsp:Transcript_8075/g.15393  ORF Transcript_8075/g.15393 Transcript_8075/m.15393 type:complete len:222 (-) Transcript_8075:136-801(-)